MILVDLLLFVQDQIRSILEDLIHFHAKPFQVSKREGFQNGTLSTQNVV